MMTYGPVISYDQWDADCMPEPDIWLDYSPAGSGKTEGILNWIKERLDSSPTGLWVIAQPTAKLLSETKERLEALGLAPEIVIERIDKETCGQGLVAKKIKKRLKELPFGAVILITHAGLKHLAGEDFAGRDVSLVIDEMPDFFAHKKVSSQTLALCKNFCDFDVIRPGVSKIRLNLDGKKWLAQPEEYGDNASDSIQSLIKWIDRGGRSVLFGHKHFFTYSLDPEIFNHAARTFLLSATPESKFFSEYCEVNGLSVGQIKLTSDWTYYQDPTYKMTFGPYGGLFSLPDTVNIKIYYLYEQTKPLAKSRLSGGIQSKLGTKLKNLFAKGILAGRKERSIVILNKGAEAVVRAGNLTDLANRGQVITPGTAGLNSLRDRDTVVYLAAVNADSSLFASFKLIYGTYQDLASFQTKTASNNMYQAVLRSALRNIRYGDTADIVIVVFGLYEAGLMQSLVLGGGSGRVATVLPATARMAAMYPDSVDTSTSKGKKKATKVQLK